MTALAARAGASAVRFPPRAGPFGNPLPTWLRDFELAVDLGDRIGAPIWWRGLFTLLALAAAIVHLFATITPLPEPVRPALPFAQARDMVALTVPPLALGAAAPARARPTSRAVRLAEPPERPRIAVVTRLAGGGVARALASGGVGPQDAAAVVELAGAQADLAQLKPGTLFDLVLGRRETRTVPRPLESVVFRAAFDLKLRIERGGDGALAVTRIPIAIDETPLRLSARVGRSLHRAAREAGAPAGAVALFARQLAHRLDLERDVRGADRFDLVLEHRRAATGETITGGLIYARLDRDRGDAIEMLRWPSGAAKPGFFLADGSSVRRGLMRTPVDGARLTSGFGLRLHPILGYSRFHRGVDFGAPHGAPIVAAAAGRVEFAGWHGGHGKYVRVGHAKGMSSAYGHMSRIAVKSGQSVGQGQVIGWVGSTGMSTGPHLHYELWQGGKAIDPRGAKLIEGPRVAAGDMARFRAELERMRGVRAGRAAELADAGGKAPAAD